MPEVPPPATAVPPSCAPPSAAISNTFCFCADSIGRFWNTRTKNKEGNCSAMFSSKEISYGLFLEHGGKPIRKENLAHFEGTVTNFATTEKELKK